MTWDTDKIIGAGLIIALLVKIGDNDSTVVRARHLEALAEAAKNYTLAELADVTISGGASYTLPTASASTKGGVKVGTGLSMSGDTLNCTVTSTTYSEATTSQAGLMSAADKSKLNNVASNANNYTLPTASTVTKGGIVVGDGLEMVGDTLNVTLDSGGGSSSEGCPTILSGNMPIFVLPTEISSVAGAIWLDTGSTVSADATGTRLVLPTVAATTTGAMWLSL